MILLFCFLHHLAVVFSLTVFDSDPIYSIKWFDSKASLLKSYHFLEAAGLNNAPDGEVTKDSSATADKLPDQLENFSSVFLKASQKDIYHCYLPDEQHLNNIENSDYNGPSPIELLSELLSGDICSHLISSYWIYQLCHGKNFRQYHEENTKTHQYSLGALEEDWETKQFTAAHKEKTWDSRLLNKITVGEIGRNAIELSMSNGSPCDIRNNKPRETIVKYVCAPKSPRAELLSVQEIATCSYIAIASVPSLCRHPDFAPTERQETSIFCVAENKPVKMPTTATHSFHYIMGDEVIIEEFPGNIVPTQQPNIQLNIPTKLAGDEDVDDTEEEEEDDEEETGWEKNNKKQALYATTEFKTPLTSSTPSLKVGSTSDSSAASLSESAKANIFKQLQAIVKGRECVKGGRGYWNHEFCYGRHVHHVHYERDFETKQVMVERRIILGQWNLKKHKDWIKTQQVATYRNIYAKNPSITLYFGDGDVCFEINKHRHTLVKLRCLPEQKTSSRISVSLTEPTLCSYVMTVDSGLLCELLTDVDEFGVPNKEKFY